VTTQEFFERVARATSDNGIVMMNIIGNFSDEKTQELPLRIANTVATVFPSVYLYNSGPLNTLLTATKNETNKYTLQAKLYMIKNEILAPFGEKMAKQFVAYSYSDKREVLTDDKAPIAQLVYVAVEDLLKNQFVH